MKDQNIEDKLQRLMAELKSRYENQTPEKSLSFLKFNNRDLQGINSIDHWVRKVYGVNAIDYLQKLGMLEMKEQRSQNEKIEPSTIINAEGAVANESNVEEETTKEKLDKAIAVLKERYRDKEPEDTFSSLMWENRDLKIGNLGVWTRQVYGKSPVEYLTEQGLILNKSVERVKDESSVEKNVSDKEAEAREDNIRNNQEERLSRLINTLKERYSDKTPESSIEVLKANNRSMAGIGSIQTLIESVHEMDATEFLRGQGLIQAKPLVNQGLSLGEDKMPEKLPVPESEQRVLDNLIRDLNETYPDKVIVRLQQDHKKWYEKVTRLYKNIGYPSRDEFLAAYGFTVEQGKGGRPSSDLKAIVEELISRYEGDRYVTTMDQLKEENPDLAPKFKNIANKSKELFGMTLAKYLGEKGVFRSAKSVEEDRRKEYQERLDVMFAELKKRYEGKELPKTIRELKESNADIDNIANIGPWIERAYIRNALDYLIELGIVQKKENEPVIIETKPKKTKQEEYEEKLGSIVSLLIERYDGKKPELSNDDFKRNNKDLNVNSFDYLSKRVYKKTAFQYLTSQGIIMSWPLRYQLERNGTRISDVVLKIIPDSSLIEYHIVNNAFPENFSYQLIEECKKNKTRLVYKLGDDELIVDVVNVDLDALKIFADCYKDTIPITLIKVISSWKSDDKAPFVNWACDAIGRKKERSVLIKLLQSKLIEQDIINEIAGSYLCRISPKGINKTDAENFAEFCVAAVDLLDHNTLRGFYDQCVEKKYKKAAQSFTDNPKTNIVLSAGNDGATNEIESFVLERFVQTDDIEFLRKYELSEVKYKDTGDHVPDYVVRFVLASYMGQLETLPTHIGNYKNDYVKFTIDQDADTVASTFERKSFVNSLNKLMINVETSNLSEFGIRSMKLIVCMARYADAEWIRGFRARFRDWASWYDHGAYGRKAIIVGQGAMMLSDTKEAMNFVDKKGWFYYYARIRGVDEDMLRYSMIADVGLDSGGSKHYSYGNTKVRVTLNSDMKLDIYNISKEKAMKSFPKDSSDEEAWKAASDDFKQLKKDIREIISSQKSTTFSEFLQERKHKADEWLAAYQSNYLLRRFAELLVWKYKNGKTELYFTFDGNQPIDVNGQPLELEGGKISVAHPLEMDALEVYKWQKLFLQHNRKQPFEQIWEPVCVNDAKPDRYAGIILDYSDFEYRGNHGIHIEDYDFHNEIIITFDDCDAEIDRRGMWRHTTDGEYVIEKFIPKKTRRANHITAYLDRITIVGRIAKDDISALEYLNRFTIAQISSFIDVCNKNHCVNCLAALLDYKNKLYLDEPIDLMKEFTLEDI